jgi:hypothetical protein
MATATYGWMKIFVEGDNAIAAAEGRGVTSNNSIDGQQ